MFLTTNMGSIDMAANSFKSSASDDMEMTVSDAKRSYQVCVRALLRASLQTLHATP